MEKKEKGQSNVSGDLRKLQEMIYSTEQDYQIKIPPTHQEKWYKIERILQAYDNQAKELEELKRKVSTIAEKVKYSVTCIDCNSSAQNSALNFTKEILNLCKGVKK